MSGIEENVQLNGVSSHSKDRKLITINQQPVMEWALHILTELVQHGTVTLEARGDLIPTAVAVANIVTENMMKGNSRIVDIVVDSESQGNFGPLVSIIAITITKTN
ncbi:MAG: DNA-binding protein [Thaumarchaeota archaeon]|nr:DNA-binding protein [Nitrososphaerota archaeon]MDE1867780.1 DNA-binding protein [Nitrososphaerota archaeon]